MRFCQSFMEELYRYLGSDQITSHNFSCVFCHLKNKWKFLYIESEHSLKEMKNIGSPG